MSQNDSDPKPDTDLAEGKFNLGGQRYRLKIDGKSPAEFLKQKIINWIIGTVVAIALIGVLLVVIRNVVAKNAAGPAAPAMRTATWDGATPFTCAGNEAVLLTGVTARAGVKAQGTCTLHLVDVDITAAVPLEAVAGAKVNVTGGSLSGTPEAVVASGAAQVTLSGTRLTGKIKKSGSAVVTTN